MNSRERRKMEAQQHNDKIRYELWLKNNATYSRAEPALERDASEYRMARQAGMPRLSALSVVQAILLMGGHR